MCVCVCAKHNAIVEPFIRAVVRGGGGGGGIIAPPRPEPNFADSYSTVKLLTFFKSLFELHDVPKCSLYKDQNSFLNGGICIGALMYW